MADKNEKLDLSLIKAEIKKLRNDIQAGHKSLKDETASKEDVYVFRLEDYCYSLRNSIVDLSLKLPSYSSFKYYFNKLQQKEDIQYILELLHQCWTLVYPDTLFNAPLKNEDLDDALCKFTGNQQHRYGNSYDLVTTELNGISNLYLAEAYYKRMQHARKVGDEQKLLLIGLQEFMSGLHQLILPVCARHNIFVREDFTIGGSLHVALNKEQLCTIFKAVAKNGYMYDNEDTQRNFLALFDNTLPAPQNRIMWLDRNKKNKQPSIASLYVMFQAMGVEMNIANKEVISHHYLDASGEQIVAENLKSRNSSGNLSTIESLVKNAIGHLQ